MKLFGYIIVGVLAVLGLITVILNIKFSGPPSDCHVYAAKSNYSPGRTYSAAVELVNCGEGIEARLKVVELKSGEFEVAELPIYIGATAIPFWEEQQELIVRYPDPINAAQPPDSVAGVLVTYEME